LDCHHVFAVALPEGESTEIILFNKATTCKALSLCHIVEDFAIPNLADVTAFAFRRLWGHEQFEQEARVELIQCHLWYAFIGESMMDLWVGKQKCACVGSRSKACIEGRIDICQRVNVDVVYPNEPCPFKA
jgi:hypothetical protein